MDSMESDLPTANAATSHSTIWIFHGSKPEVRLARCHEATNPSVRRLEAASPAMRSTDSPSIRGFEVAELANGAGK